jgi:electron transfer flavoprotein alpha subunit
MATNILVFAERRDGQIKRPSLEAIGAARTLADAHGGRVDVLALGPGAAAAAGQVGSHGADRLLACEADYLELYAPGAYAATLAEAARSCDAGVVLVPGTIQGRDLAPRAAARMETGCLSDLVEVEIDANGALRGRRPVYSGKAYARVAIPQARPAFATLRPNVFAASTGGGPAEVVAVEPGMPADAIKVRVTRVEQAGEQELDVAEAAIIVSGGRGLKGPEHFALIRDLADALGGAVGASRAVVDAGWIPHAHQVGQTGKVVSPNLYVACGISGAIQHLAGMSSSKVIVAVNKDPEAPIFKLADYGIVGDVFEVLPQLTAAVRELKAEG